MHPAHGQACHSLSGAWTQARERYAKPCRLRELAREAGVVRLMDIGTGLGLNLAAALEAVTQEGGTLQVVTFEADSELLREARNLVDWPADVAPWIERVHEALRAPSANGLDLTLVLGDARTTLPKLDRGAFDAVFLDPFSPRVEPDLWSEPFLRAIGARVTPNAILSTYSASLGVRVALQRAGWTVGRGPRVGTKNEGTLASLHGTVPPLEERTRRKLLRRCSQEPC